MYVRQQSYWELQHMFGDNLSQELRLSFKERYSGNVMDFSVEINQAREFYDQLGRRIKQAETGNYPL